MKTTKSFRKEISKPQHNPETKLRQKIISIKLLFSVCPFYYFIITKKKRRNPLTYPNFYSFPFFTLIFGFPYKMRWSPWQIIRTQRNHL